MGLTPVFGKCPHHPPVAKALSYGSCSSLTSRLQRGPAGPEVELEAGIESGIRAQVCRPLSAGLVRAVGEDEVKFQLGIVDVDVGGTCYGMNKRPGSRSFPDWRSGGYRHDTDRYSPWMEVDSGRLPHRRPRLVQKAARATLPSSPRLIRSAALPDETPQLATSRAIPPRQQRSTVMRET